MYGYIYITTNLLTGKNNPSFGKHWYNNGVTYVLAFTCPDGFTSGRLKNG